MSFAPPRVTKTPNIERISVKDWLQGTVTAFDDGRTPTDGLRGSGNTVLEQDGTIRPRPSLVRYGTQPTGTILGEVFEYVKAGTTINTNYMICMQNVAGTTKPYISIDGGAWTIVNGKTYDNVAKAHFCQIDDKVLIMNGVDNLSYMDIPTAVVTPFVTLTTPGAPTLTTNTGLSGSTYNITYRVSANSTVGESIASVALSTPVSTDRELWTPATQNITIGWTAVANAVSYNVYVGTVSGFEYLVAYGVNGTSFKDDGTLVKDVTRLFPTTDSTAGPKTTRGTVINGQVFMTGDADHLRYIWFGGTGKAILDFSPANGGGNVEVGRGTKEFPVRVMPFRDGRGNSAITVLCRGTNGRGKRYILSPQTTTVGAILISFFSVDEDNGQDGTDSPDAVVLYRDSLWYPSRDGFKTTGTKPQLQNLLSTDTVSETIITDVKNLNTVAMDKSVGLAYEGRIYFAVPVGSSSNSEIWSLDLNRKGAWMKPWNIAASWMMLYNDNSGLTHFLVVQNNVIYELSYAQFTNDDGAAFPTSITSGLLKFSEDGTDWAKVIDVTFFVQRPQGTFNFSVAGKTEDASLATVGSTTFTTTSSVAGWSEAAWFPGYIWSGLPLVPTQYGDANKPVVIEVDEELQYLTYEINSISTGVDFQLSDVIVRFVRIGYKDLT